MPTADYTPPRASGLPDFLRKLTEQEQSDLAAEVAALRRTVEELVTELRPPSTIIATGRDVLEQYKNLKGLTR
jgi:hypothetical protein